MKKSLYIAILATLAMMMPACSHNNGGDDTFWGTWKLTAITIDGARDTGYADDYFWKFQGDVVVIMQVDDIMHERIEHTGTWSSSESSSVLTLNFTHSDDANPPGTGLYSPPAGIYIVQPVTTLTVVDRSGDNLVLTHSTSLGQIRYYLERW